MPYKPEVTLSSEHFRVLLRRRVRLPLPFTDATCRCGGPLDEFGDHRSACPTAGFLRTRALPPLNARSLAYAEKPAADCTPTSPSTR